MNILLLLLLISIYVISINLLLFEHYVILYYSYVEMLIIDRLNILTWQHINISNNAILLIIPFSLVSITMKSWLVFDLKLITSKPSIVTSHLLSAKKNLKFFGYKNKLIVLISIILYLIKKCSFILYVITLHLDLQN